MSDELRAAAKLMIKHLPPPGITKIGSFDVACLAIAKAYLAEHPSDDGELVTEEWLKVAGGKHQMSGVYSFFGSQSDDENLVWVDVRPDNGATSLTLVPPKGEGNELRVWLGKKTRLDVRLLCSALGIQLNEKASS